jgi:hypothetical protein
MGDLRVRGGLGRPGLVPFDAPAGGAGRGDGDAAHDGDLADGGLDDLGDLAA